MDNLLQLYEINPSSFFSIQNIRTFEDNYSDNDNSLVTIYLRSDRFFDQYERKVYDILTFLADIGGLKEALLGIGMIFVSFLSQKMLMSKIIKKIYHIRKYENIDNEINRKKNSVTPAETLNNQSNDDDFGDSGPEKDFRKGLNSIKDKEHKLSQKFKHKDHITKKDMPNLFFAFLNRARFKYSLSMIF